MQADRRVQVSRSLSYYLRHRPDLLGVELDSGGWVSVYELLTRFSSAVYPLTKVELVEVVVSNDKRRFEFDSSSALIRATQGHSVPVDLGLESSVPPPVLFHGTSFKAWETIQDQGLLPMRRHDVHLTASRDHAVRRAEQKSGLVLNVDSGAMHLAGHTFRVTSNGVWLVPRVPPYYVIST